MNTLDRIIILGCTFLVTVSSVTTAIKAESITGIQKDRLSLDKAIKASHDEMIRAQSMQFQALVKQLKAEEDRANAQARELHYLKLEMDEFKRSRAGMMRLFEILNPKVKP